MYVTHLINSTILHRYLFQQLALLFLREENFELADNVMYLLFVSVPRSNEICVVINIHHHLDMMKQMMLFDLGVCFSSVLRLFSNYLQGKMNGVAI